MLGIHSTQVISANGLHHFPHCFQIHLVLVPFNIGTTNENHSGFTVWFTVFSNVKVLYWKIQQTPINNNVTMFFDVLFRKHHLCQFLIHVLTFISAALAILHACFQM